MNDKAVTIQMPSGLYESATKKAQSMGLSFAAYVRLLLNADINETKTPPP